MKVQILLGLNTIALILENGYHGGEMKSKLRYYDWAELVTEIICFEEDFKEDDLDEVLESAAKTKILNIAWNNCKERTILVQECKDWINRFYSQERMSDYDTSLWEGLVAIEEEEVFLNYLAILLTCLWD